MSAATKALGSAFTVLAVPMLLAALVLLASEETFVPDPLGDRGQSGILYAGVGLAFLVVGVVFLVMKPKAPQVTPEARSASPPRRHVEIKRTEMNVGRPEPSPGPAEAAESSLDEEIEEMTRKISRLKVQYGMGEISKESFRRLRDELEKEKAELELRRAHGERE